MMVLPFFFIFITVIKKKFLFKLMTKTIIITEEMENDLIKFILSEEYIYPDPDKVLIVKNYLDSNFTPTTIPDVNDNGMPSKVKAVVTKNGSNTMSLQDLFYMVQEKFKNLVSNQKNRDKFLKQVINDWTDGKITKEGSLSVNFF